MSAAHDLDAEAWWAEHQRIAAERAAAVARIVAGGERPLRMPGGWPECPMTLLVHRDTYAGTAGQWRVTRFDGDDPDDIGTDEDHPDANVGGHCTYPTFQRAIEDCYSWRGKLDEAREP